MSRLEISLEARFEYLLNLNVNGQLTNPVLIEELKKLAEMLGRKPYR